MDGSRPKRVLADLRDLRSTVVVDARHLPKVMRSNEGNVPVDRLALVLVTINDADLPRLRVSRPPDERRTIPNAKVPTDVQRPPRNVGVVSEGDKRPFRVDDT